MTYSNFTLRDVMSKFGLTVDTTRDLFGHVPPVSLGTGIRDQLEQHLPLASLMATERGKTQLLVAPLMAEVWFKTHRQVSVFSGEPFDVDADAGLTGECDFLIARGPHVPFIIPPVLAVVPHRIDDHTSGYGPCSAELVAALRLNTRANTGVEVVYGAVTTAFSWKFMQLRGNVLSIDIAEYTVHDPDRILGILLHMVGHNPPAAAAA